MAAREPLVIVNGQIRQRPSGDTINIGVTPGSLTFEATNINGGTINKLSAVYMSGNDSVSLATANDAATAKFVGFVDAETTNNSTCNVHFGGVVTGNTAEWDAVAGTTNGLTFNTIYYLDDTNPGQVTAVPPTAADSYVKPVGIALSDTDLLILQQQSVLL